MQIRMAGLGLAMCFLASVAPLAAQGNDEIFAWTGPPLGGVQLVLNGSIKINATTTGWYTPAGLNSIAQNGGPLANYLTGVCAATCLNLTIFRSFFAFDLSGVNGPITSAFLNAANPINNNPCPGCSPNGYQSSKSNDVLSFFSVSTPIAQLTAAQFNRADIYTALGSGTLYGARYVDASTNGKVVETALNGAALAAITAAEGGPIAFAGQMNAPGVTPTAPGVNVGSVVGSTASSITMTFTFIDVNSYVDLSVLDILINRTLDGRGGCYVAFTPSGANSGTLALVDDAGDAGGPYSTTTLPGNGTVSNSQCTLSATSSASGDTITITVTIMFSAGFAGNKVVYVSAGSQNGTNSNWQALGTVGVQGPPPTGPAVGGVTPSRTTSLGPTTYAFAFTDTAGTQDIGVANVLINSAIDGRHACYVAFAPASNSLYLVDDAGDAGGPYQGLVLPSNNSISNSQCTINGAGSSVQRNGNTLTLSLAITFSSGFTGNQVIYLATRNGTQNSDWQPVGSVTVP